MDTSSSRFAQSADIELSAESSVMARAKERQLVVAPKLSLVTSIYGFLLLFTFSFLSILALAVSSRSDLVFSGALSDAASVRTNVATREVAQVLNSEWKQLDHLVQLVESGASTEVVRAAMLALAVDSSNQSWSGLISPTGDVVLSTSENVVGMGVQSAGWLQGGLVRGDLRIGNDFPYLEGPAVIMTLPIFKDGRSIGVVATALELSAIENGIHDAAAALGLDLLLTDSGDRVVMSTIPGVGSDTKIVVGGTTGLAAEQATKQVWPDGKTYYLSRPFDVVVEGGPSLGWKITGRLESTSFSVAVREVLRFALVVGAGLSLALAIIAVIFVNVFVKPISRLAQASVEIANGSKGYPPEIRTSAESARLSAALAKLQALRSGPNL